MTNFFYFLQKRFSGRRKQLLLKKGTLQITRSSGSSFVKNKRIIGFNQNNGWDESNVELMNIDLP